MNILSSPDTLQQLLQCCGSRAWAKRMLAELPIKNADLLFERADTIWSTLSQEDYLEAFSHHPQIGDLDSLQKKFASTASFASQEQKSVSGASTLVLNELMTWNKKYLQKFGFIFIVCATSKQPDWMLDQLKLRFENSRDTEIQNAAHEQSMITRIRLNQWLQTLK